ncbi:MAG: family oxidoreductase [Caulobacter sp.]|nr:family oxidoreductase [Caulobacter sp.]
MGRLDGRVVLITGGTEGIGRACALKAVAEGAKVVVGGRGGERGAQTVRLVREAGGEALYLPLDVGKRESLYRFIEEGAAHFGRLDGAINNAAIESRSAPLHRQSDEEIDEMIEITLKGVIFAMKAEITLMLKSGGGAIVNTGSVGATLGMAGISPYVAAKHGVLGVTRTAAIEYAQANIRINAVCPGGVLTPMAHRQLENHPEAFVAAAAAHPIGRLGRPSELADVAIWLLSDESSFVIGEAIMVDGGFTARSVFPTTYALPVD